MMKRKKTGFLLILLAGMFSLSSMTVAISAESPDFNFVIGEWGRSDGDYTLRIRGVKPDGSVDLGYFNPDKIHVAESSISNYKGLVKLSVKLQDRGYPGSTYTLYYYAEKDSLAGFYYQAAMDQTFEVIFFRK